MNWADSDSDDDSDLAYGAAGVPPPAASSQVQTGYNSYGRPSMTAAANNSFPQQQQQQSDDSDSSSDDDDDDSEDESTAKAAAAPAQPRGKTFRPPVGDGYSSSSSSEDEGGGGGDALKSTSNATTSQINPNPGPPRGKELRLMHKPDSSDDEPMTTRKSSAKGKGGKGAKSNGARKKSASSSNATTKKSTTRKKATKRKAPHNDNDTDSDSDDECIATIVGGSDSEGGVMATVVSSTSNKRSKSNSGTALKKDGTPRKKPGPKKGWNKKPGAEGVSKSSSGNRGGSSGKKSSASATATIVTMPEVSAEKATAAQSARTTLQDAVSRLPHKVTDSHTIRSFGRIKPEYNVSNPLDALYSSPHAIYPVGFSCDRFEFSPIHGRVIKMRCDILDGSVLKESREGMKKEMEKASNGKESGKDDEKKDNTPALVEESHDKSVPGGDVENLGDGPVFRVTWGEGVEEDKLLEPSCPFDPYVASAHLGGDVDAIAVPLSSKKGGKPAGLPEVGMRVSVRFDKGKMHGGAITKVEPIEKKPKSRKKAICDITILYDDGVTEVAGFPDPDIQVAYQGCPPIETADGFVTEMNGKAVRSVLAKSPLEAWGKTLLSLGLIDEIMYAAALQELHSAREDGFNEVRDKLDAANKKRREDRAKEKSRRAGMRSSGDDDKSMGTDADTSMMDDGSDKEDKREKPSEQEERLRATLAELHRKLAAAKKRSKAASLTLANARISAISPFAANPFLCKPDSSTVESSWLSAAAKKEKSKMANTGNKRKIVNPATLMDKNDTFFDPKIEKLVEGLPGSEFAPSYVFHGNRSASGSQAWIHEAKLRHQKQQKKKQEKVQKATKLAESKAKAEEEKMLKRKLKEEELENKKRQKEEEEEKKKKERIEKRLNLLSTQMDDRLFKESCMMREKNIMNFVRGLNKEFTRRRKAAELAVGSKIENSSTASPCMDTSSSILAPFDQMLPPLSRPYDVDVVRIWDFLHSFPDAFSKPDAPVSLPSLDSLQDAMNSIKTNASDQPKAVDLFQGIAMDLCKVISPSLTKILASSVPNIEPIGKNGTDGGPQEDADVACLPVTEWSWREVARMSIIYDVLMDLGYSKVESANFVKGYRSGGHPNSKEAKRWKKIEESPIIMMYQRLRHQDVASDPLRSRVVRATLSTPCTPSSVPTDWRFFLHNIKSRSSNSLRFMKNNVTKALSALKEDAPNVKDSDSHISNLEKCLAILDKLGHGNDNGPQLHKAKQMAVEVLDSTKEACHLPISKDAVKATDIQLMAKQTDATQEPARQRMGFQEMYHMSKEQFKALEQSKEEYMAAALRLKEELERKSKADANEEDDDDDEEDDAEDNAQSDKPAKEQNESETKESPEGETKVPSDPTTDDAVAQGKTKSNGSEEAKNPEAGASPAKAATNKAAKDEGKAESNGSEEAKSPEADALATESADGKATEDHDGATVDKPSDQDDKTDEMEVDPKAEEDNPEADASSDKPNEPSDVADFVNTTNHPTVSEKDEHIQADPAEGFPDGWVVRRLPRLNPNDKRTDRNWYSPKLGLKFRSKTDAMRFLEKLEEANGDEAVAIVEYHGKKKAPKPADKPPTRGVGRPPKAAPKAAAAAAAVEVEEGDSKVEYEWSEDVPNAPDLIRRCLAVIRTLCQSNSADQFIYPVDPQLYPSYYETVTSPTSLYDIGKLLQESGTKFSSNHDDPEIEEVVASVGRLVRTIAQNTICVNSSNFLVNSAEEMLRIFERLFFDWVLAPSTDRPAMDELDDDRCIDHHESDINSMVLLCDACEGKYNMARLKPPLHRVPSGDWYCPRCVSGRSWLTADPRIGRRVKNGPFSGSVQTCKFLFNQVGKPEIVYCVKSVNSGDIQYWGVNDVDKWLVGDQVEPLRCLQALSESPGYGFGRDSSFAGGAVPLAINPLVGDKAAQAALSSGVFKDTVSACVSLTNAPEDFTAKEWINLLMLLVTKCSQSEELQELSTKLENKENSRLSSDMMTFWRARAAKNIVQNLSDDDSDSSDEESVGARPPSGPSDIPSVVESKTKKEEPSKEDAPPSDIVMKSSGEDPSVGERPVNMDISFNSSTDAPDEVSSSNNVAQPKDPVVSAEELLRRKQEVVWNRKSSRERKREEALIGYYVGNRLKPTAASFDEDFLSTIVKSTLCNQEEGLNLPSVRCRETCHYCGLSDVALCAPLCRTPNEKEWRETFPHAVHERTTYMVAEIPDKSNRDPMDLDGSMASTDSTVAEKPPKVVTVRVRVGGDLVSSKTKCIDKSGKNHNFDTAMQQFLPKNPAGFQSELRFRHEANLSILTGSITAHEMCAVAAHRSHKEKLLKERRAFHRANMTREAALACGKSIPIGTDPFGRSYWVFGADQASLFVCQVDSKSSATEPSRTWLRFHKPEEIAAVMICLGKDPLVESLKEVFPEATKVVKDRSWSTSLMGRRLTKESEEAKPSPKESDGMDTEEQNDFGAPFVEDEDVLVESENGKFLWDAVVVEVSKDAETEKVDGYRVHYKNWSSRFDQWVAPDRVVEPNQVNLEVQEEVLQDFSNANEESPSTLEGMFAFDFIDAKKRARSTPVCKTELFESAVTRPSASHDEKFLGLLKGAILTIEAALPRGSIGSYHWNDQAAALWRNLVKDAQGPESLMKCVLLLENAISPDWLHSQATQLYSAVPKSWRAAKEASLPAIALRISILDRTIKYEAKKKKKHESLSSLIS